MNTKLTLSINKRTIDEAKRYARKMNTSLSNLVENYLISVTNKSKTGEEEAVSPLVRSLSGILNVDTKQHHKKLYSDFLANKYK